MVKPVNLANPDFEPTDSQLNELSRLAFAPVPEEDRLRLLALRERIAQGRAQLLAQLEFPH
jgi:hypothetical protein